VFADDSDEPAGLVPLVTPAWTLTGIELDRYGYFGVGHAARVDRLGRRWVLEAIDLAAIEADLVEATARVAEGEFAEQIAIDALLVDDEPGIDFAEPIAGAEIEWVELDVWPEWNSRLDRQATTMFDDFDDRSELATGDDDTNTVWPQGLRTPTIYGFFPDCATAPTHNGAFNGPYYNNVAIDGVQYNAWLEEFAMDVERNQEQLLITQGLQHPTSGCP
jgi:hypothetical protein